jgi:rRNA maturation endonuclease Nob1
MTTTERTTSYYYICDGCGNVVTITEAPIPEGQAWQCDECGSEALWEFTDKTNAINHSEHIRRIVQSGLFRRLP